MKMHTRIHIIITIFVALWCIGILAAPVLKHSGDDKDAQVLYSFYSRICHQIDARSFHFEGEKLGVCIRCSAIYFGFLIGLLLMPIFRIFKKINIQRRSLLIAIIFPILLDVVLNVVDLHNSTTMTRIFTGALFGSIMSWYILSLLTEACLQIVQRKNNL
jgi:uncharacterized membrane protein